MQNNPQPLYSIIIPHHNRPDLLKRCLRSIPDRPDLQVIVVDDQSDAVFLPGLAAVKNEFRDFTYISAPRNGGGGFARNIGLGLARGKYLFFADADDFFNNCFSTVLDDYQTEESDIVFFDATSVYSDTLQPAGRSFQLNRIHQYHDSNPKKAELCLRYLFGEPWCKMIRRALLTEHQIRFDETPIHNDARFSYLVGYFAYTVKVDHRTLYCVTFRPDSISKQASDTTQRLRIEVFGKKNRFLADHRIKAFDEILLWPFKYYIKQKNREQLNSCFQLAKTYGYSKIRLFYLLLKRKIFHLNNTNWCKA